MGLTSKTTGKFRGMLQRAENELEKEREAKKKADSKEVKKNGLGK